MAVPARSRSTTALLRPRFPRIRALLTAGTLALVFVAMSAVLIATFVIQLMRVNGASMQPTLDDHDYLVVDRLSYEIGTPQPGDIVTLYYPFDPDRVFVKRVIAVDG